MKSLRKFFMDLEAQLVNALQEKKVYRVDTRLAKLVIKEPETLSMLADWEQKDMLACYEKAMDFAAHFENRVFGIGMESSSTPS